MDLKNNKYIWIFGLFVTLALILIPVVFVLVTNRQASASDNPRAHLPERKPHTDHKDLLKGPFNSGPEVTQVCLECHPDSASQVMATVHWTWESKPYQLARFDSPITVGKKNSINNFCIGIQSNWAGCTSCHAGYGWEDANFDFTNQNNVDCLACHDQSGIYAKTKGGYVMEGVDLLTSAKSVGYPTRTNCGSCHFNGGGGDAVKHGDLDQTLIFPADTLDVHMGKNKMQCTDCHTTKDHVIRGRATSVSLDNENQAYCTDCHVPTPHEDERLNVHTDSVACQTCHIPSFAREEGTKVTWDWSTAGQDLPEDPHKYLKIKGSFVYEENVTPTYLWYSGVADRYILGDKIDPGQPTKINTIKGSINDPEAKIFPFKVHIAKQPYDSVNNYLVQPMTAGNGGFWTTFDWQSAISAGMQTIGLPYSGQYGFTETWMYWPITHMVAPANQALQCNACHGEQGRLDWIALGYPGDPMKWGSRVLTK